MHKMYCICYAGSRKFTCYLALYRYHTPLYPLNTTTFHAFFRSSHYRTHSSSYRRRMIHLPDTHSGSRYSDYSLLTGFPRMCPDGYRENRRFRDTHYPTAPCEENNSLSLWVGDPPRWERVGVRAWRGQRGVKTQNQNPDRDSDARARYPDRGEFSGIRTVCWTPSGGRILRGQAGKSGRTAPTRGGYPDCHPGTALGPYGTRVYLPCGHRDIRP